MKRALVPLSIAFAAALGLGGCSMFHQRMPAPVAPAAPVAAPVAASAVETIPFHTGVSSATVEKMAKQQGCTGGLGAGLITQPGPVEVYRMRCEDGKVFMARCELRQCTRM
jgi:hypothetical protein